MINFTNKKGETLLEVLIALTLIVVTSAAAASAIMSATKSLSLSRNYLIAQNLGSEALEAVKNIRDTNWMKFPINKENCWLVIGEISEAEDCVTSAQLAYNPTQGAVNDYTVKFENNKWIITKSTNSIEGNINGFALYQSQDRYISTMPPAGSPSFYRAIRTIAQDGSSITVEAIVKWYEGSKLYEIKGKEVLTNYLE